MRISTRSFSIFTFLVRRRSAHDRFPLLDCALRRGRMDGPGTGARPLSLGVPFVCSKPPRRIDSVDCSRRAGVILAVDVGLGIPPASFFSTSMLKSDPFAVCSASGTLRTFETIRGVVTYVDEKSLSSWAVYKLRCGHWRHVKLTEGMNPSQMHLAICSA